jgi:hypothetical protein
MGGRSTADREPVETVEPIFLNFVKVALQGCGEFNWMKNAAMEKYAYTDFTGSITSCTSPCLIVIARAQYPPYATSSIFAFSPLTSSCARACPRYAPSSRLGVGEIL